MSHKEQQMLTILLACLASFALIYFIMRPQLTQLSERAVAVAARLREIDTLESRKVELAALEKAMSQAAAEIGQLDLAVPSNPGYPELLVELAVMSQATGMRLTTVQPAQIGQSSTDDQLATVTLKGTYPQLVDFASSAGVNLRPLVLKTINIADTGTTTGEARELVVTLQISVARAGLTQGGA